MSKKKMPTLTKKTALASATTLFVVAMISSAAAVIHKPGGNTLHNRSHRSSRAYANYSPVHRQRGSALNDFMDLPKETKQEAASSKEKTCIGYDANNATEITLSPLSKNGTVLLQLKKPADFSAEETVKYEVTQSPVDHSEEPAQPFAVNATDFLTVATDRLYDNVDLSKTYDQPALIAINASSSSKVCIMYYMLRFFDAFFAFEPDWEANPILESGYHFAVDCPGPDKPLGRVGDENRNDIYHVKYDIESSNNSESDNVKKLFSIDRVNGKLQTSSDTDFTSDSKWKNTTQQFRISASAPDHRAVYAIVYVNFGNCDGKIKSTGEIDSLKRRFLAKCAAPGDIIGQLPRGIKNQNFTSYVMFPSEREFSVTADGQIRVREIDLKKAQNYTVFISAPTSDGQTTVYEVTVEVQPCDIVLNDASSTTDDEPKQSVLPNLGTIEMACPYASEIIANLSDLKPFVNELRGYLKRVNKPARFTVYFSTNMTDLIQITPDQRIYWLHTPRALQSLTNIAVEITAQAAGGKNPARLGYVTLSRPKSAAGQEQLKAMKQQQTAVQQKCDWHEKQNRFHQTIDLLCPRKGQYITYVSTAFLSPIIQRSSFEFRVGPSEFFDIEPTSGIIFVKKPPQRGLEVSMQLPVSVVGQTKFESVIGKKAVYDGLLTVRISCPKPVSDSNVEKSARGPMITCESFDFRSPLPIGVAVRGGNSLNREFVAQVFADVTGDEGVPNVPKYRWSLDGKTGYKIDPYSGRIFQTNTQPNATFSVRATSTAKASVWCEMQIQPKILDTTQFSQATARTALGLVNRQPPRFLSKRIHFSRTAQTCGQVRGKNVFSLPAGLNLGRIVAFDPDDGLAGAINYTLCAYKNNVVQNCGETLRVDISAKNYVEGARHLYLQIDSRLGNIFVAHTQVVADQQTISFGVRASNTKQRRLPDNRVAVENNAEFTGLPASQSTDTAEVILHLICASTVAAANDVVQ